MSERAVRGGRSGRLLAGRYRLLDGVGRGGMGVVWRARDELLAREVAVKEVRPPAGVEEPGARRLYARLEQEARAAARVHHPNAITVFDVTTDGGRPWIVMELVHGPSLAEVLAAEGRLDPERAARIGARVLGALRTAHAAGVLHRDVKPGNVLLDGGGRVVLTDFGLAAVEGAAALTPIGELLGSPDYLAPERAVGRRPGPPCDLWSLGVTLYLAVEGLLPFHRDTPLDTLRAVVDEDYPPPRRADGLGPVLEGLLRKDPAARMDGWQAQRLLDAVASRRAGPPVPAGARGSGAPVPLPVPVQVPAPVFRDEPRPVRPVRRAATLAAALTLAGCGMAWTLLWPAGSPAPPVVVSVRLTAVRDRYAGGCPPSAARAPEFAAVVRVGAGPPRMVYRWTTDRGPATGWRAAALPPGGVRQLTLRQAVAVAGGRTGWVAVQVREPVAYTSGRAAFTVACAGAPGPAAERAPGGSAGRGGEHRQVTAGLAGGGGVVGLGDRVGQAVQPPDAAGADLVGREGGAHVAEGEAVVGGALGDDPVEQVGGVVDGLPLGVAQAQQAVAVDLVEARVAEDDDVGGGGLGADRRVDVVEQCGQGVLGVCACLVDAVDAGAVGAGDAGGHHVGEAGVVAADGDADQAGGGGERGELALQDVAGLGTAARGEREGRGGVRRRPQVGVRLRAARTAAAGADVAAGADACRVGVAESDVTGPRRARGARLEQGEAAGEKERGRGGDNSGQSHGTSLSRSSATPVVAARRVSRKCPCQKFLRSGAFARVSASVPTRAVDGARAGARRWRVVNRRGRTRT
ncbi:serine/threonine protein kinase [Streptantibioticus cattleyicolor NRRL 8057 = DSM 46488]|uniref:non-specific serine/threonine protein kinase n=1 Tax=Streptantibioticus cattleyicolor (strain ATCC 35852 / DSM 46488 / JCM 4925 / NBRC 14057 / NRRL 8057) TaxID=1003195 RepID=G8X1W8_STREN|nr:serine/threonine protein kinase [Streptantibioticus cattleyicolor NRRL 8057 = DSM 46488]